MKSPCYECNKRKLGCHGKCEAYKEMKDELEVIRQKKIRERDFNSYVFYRYKSVMKLKGVKV